MPDSSDESTAEGVGLLQNDDSETMSSGSDSEDDSVKGTAGNGFLDVEASESGDSDSDDDSDSDEASILGGGRSSRGPRAYFPHFKKLPIEMRHRIWEFFCPDLHPSPRVFSFQMLPNPKQSSIWESPTLENQIAHVNAMLGVHRESREFALKAFPDALAIRQGRRTVRFNKQRDVVLINGQSRTWNHNASVPGFSEHVLNLALNVEIDEEPSSLQILAAFPNLVNFYTLNWHNEGRTPGSLRWCASDKTLRYEIQHLQRDFRIGEDMHFIYCWPDLVNHRDFAEEHASAAHDAEVALGILAQEAADEESMDFAMEDEDVKRISKINFWRMTGFGWDAADRFPAFLAKYRGLDPDVPSEDGEDDDDERSSDDDDEDDSDHDEYESDGIDDRPLDEQSLDEDDDLLDTRLESEDEEDGGASDFGGFSPLRGEDGDLPAASFSSPEPESDGGDRRRRGVRRAVVDSEDEDEDDDVEEVTRGSSSRAPVVLSDDEDEEEKPSQSTSRRRRVVVSDDEDDEEEDPKPARPAGRRARVLLSDDEDEDEDEGGAGVGGVETREDDSDDEPARKPLSLAEKLQRNRRQDPISDEEGSEESSEEESSEEEAPLKRVSLAQKLMAHRRRNPIESEEEDSEGSIVDDDEEDEDEDEDEDERGMFMSMADEGESDDEEDEDEDQY